MTASLLLGAPPSLGGLDHEAFEGVGEIHVEANARLGAALGLGDEGLGAAVAIVEVTRVALSTIALVDDEFALAEGEGFADAAELA